MSTRKVRSGFTPTATGVALVAGLAAGAIPSESLDAAPPSPWSRSSAYALGETGLLEKYDSNQANSVWSDDDTWNETGADCSGYVNKVWQVDQFKTISQNYHGPYSTWHWYNNQVDGAYQLALPVGGGAIEQLNIDVWVRRWTQPSNGATGGHMGVWEGSYDAATSKWKLWHAKGTDWGILHEYKGASYFQAFSLDGKDYTVSRRFKRTNW